MLWSLFYTDAFTVLDIVSIEESSLCSPVVIHDRQFHIRIHRNYEISCLQIFCLYAASMQILFCWFLSLVGPAEWCRIQRNT